MNGLPAYVQTVGCTLPVSEAYFPVHLMGNEANCSNFFTGSSGASLPPGGGRLGSHSKLPRLRTSTHYARHQRLQYRYRYRPLIDRFAVNIVPNL